MVIPACSWRVSRFFNIPGPPPKACGSNRVNTFMHRPEPTSIRDGPSARPYFEVTAEIANHPDPGVSPDPRLKRQTPCPSLPGRKAYPPARPLMNETLPAPRRRESWKRGDGSKSPRRSLEVGIGLAHPLSMTSTCDRLLAAYQTFRENGLVSLMTSPGCLLAICTY